MPAPADQREHQGAGGEAPELERLRAELATVKRQRELLAIAIRDAAVSAGICKDDVDLSGPHLLLLAGDLSDAAGRAVRAQQEPGYGVSPVATVVDEDGELRVVWTIEDPDTRFAAGAILYSASASDVDKYRIVPNEPTPEWIANMVKRGWNGTLIPEPIIRDVLETAPHN